MADNIIFSQLAGVNDSVFGKSQEPIRLFVENHAEGFEQHSIINKVYNVQNTNNYADKMTSMTSMEGFAPVGEGGAYPRSDMQEGDSKIIEQMTWKNSFVVTQEMVEDAKTMDLKRVSHAFVQSFYRTRELLAAGLLGKAVGGADLSMGGRKFSTKSADDAYLFSTQHGKRKQTNKFADAFSADVLSEIESRMHQFRDNEGNILTVSPDTIIVPDDGELIKEVFAAIGADKDPATANNGFNYQFGRWNVISTPYLNEFLDMSTNKPFIIMDSKYNEIYGGAVWLDRVKLNIKSYIDENTDNNVWKGRARFAAGFNDWRAFAVGGVTGGTTL